MPIRARRATANRNLTVLKAALNHAWQGGKITGSDEAWRKVKPFRGADAARVRYLQIDECTRLLNACEPDFRRLVRGALVTGARYGELCRADVRDFNPDSASLLVRESKGGKPRGFRSMMRLRRSWPASRPGVRERPAVHPSRWRPLGQVAPAPAAARGVQGGADRACDRISHPAPHLGVAPDHGRAAAHGRGSGARPQRYADGREALRPPGAELHPRGRARYGAAPRAGERYHRDVDQAGGSIMNLEIWLTLARTDLSQPLSEEIRTAIKSTAAAIEQLALARRSPADKTAARMAKTVGLTAGEIGKFRVEQAALWSTMIIKFNRSHPGHRQI